MDDFDMGGMNDAIDSMRERIAELEAENERLLDHIRQMLNVPEFARNSMKDQCIAERDAEIERLREALVEIINTPNKSEGESAETLATMMQDIAFAAIAKAEGE